MHHTLLDPYSVEPLSGTHCISDEENMQLIGFREGRKAQSNTVYKDGRLWGLEEVGRTTSAIWRLSEWQNCGLSGFLIRIKAF